MTTSPEKEVEAAVQQAIEALALGFPVDGSPVEKRIYVDRLAKAIEACARDVQARYLKT